MHPAGLLDGPQHDNIIRSPSKINPILTPHIHQPHILRLVIISFVAAWLARVLLSFKRTQSSGNDDVDEGQHIPFWREGLKDSSRLPSDADEVFGNP